jgi:2,3-bisphosphoglycerate-independent phosphoglycerate mutase
VKILYDPLRVYRIRGAFEAGRHVDTTYGVSMFRVRDARVEEARGAKIFKVGEPAPAPTKP